MPVARYHLSEIKSSASPNNQNSSPPSSTVKADQASKAIPNPTQTNGAIKEALEKIFKGPNVEVVVLDLTKKTNAPDDGGPEELQTLELPINHPIPISGQTQPRHCPNHYPQNNVPTQPLVSIKPEELKLHRQKNYYLVRAIFFIALGILIGSILLYKKVLT